MFMPIMMTKKIVDHAASGNTAFQNLMIVAEAASSKNAFNKLKKKLKFSILYQ